MSDTNGFQCVRVLQDGELESISPKKAADSDTLIAVGKGQILILRPEGESTFRHLIATRAAQKLRIAQALRATITEVPPSYRSDVIEHISGPKSDRPFEMPEGPFREERVEPPIVPSEMVEVGSAFGPQKPVSEAAVISFLEEKLVKPSQRRDKTVFLPGEVTSQERVQEPRVRESQTVKLQPAPQRKSGLTSILDSEAGRPPPEVPRAFERIDWKDETPNLAPKSPSAGLYLELSRKLDTIIEKLDQLLARS